MCYFKLYKTKQLYKYLICTVNVQTIKYKLFLYLCKWPSEYIKFYNIIYYMTFVSKSYDKLYKTEPLYNVKFIKYK